MSRIIIVDETDTPIGAKERNEIETNDIYRVTGLWLTNSKGEILLAKRASAKKVNPGLWGPAVAGTVEDGETYDENIVKEVGEELGLHVLVADLRRGQKMMVNGKRTYFAQWYLYSVDRSARDFNLQQEEVEQVKWFTKQELLDALEQRPTDFIPSFSDKLRDFL